MIKIKDGNLLQAEAEALVNTVNCVGYMGKGIALQFKQAFPENFKAYERACRTKAVRPGRMFVFETGSMINPKYIINFPTKRHWRGKSRIKDIQAGIKALIEEVRNRDIRTIAVPPLGCGLGGLNWKEVRNMLEEAFSLMPNVEVFLYAPLGAPDAKTMPVRTKKPKMTTARALFVKLIAQYLDFAYRLTLLEIQKLAYFLQASGEPLRLRFEAGLYGPYAANLNKVLERIEGHFIRGYGDTQNPEADIELLDGAVEKANEFLADKDASRERLQKVASVIEGFETPYGMELLSTVHWVAKYQEPAAEDEDIAVRAVHQWNERKRSMFKEKHIRMAWQRLEKEKWL